MTKMFRTCALGGRMIVLKYLRWMTVTPLIIGDRRLRETDYSSKWNISPPWTMTERTKFQTKLSRFSDRKVVKIKQVTSDYFKIKMFCFQYHQWERHCRVISCERRRPCRISTSDKMPVHVGDLFVQEACEGHEALEEEAQEDGGESEGSDDTVW